MKSSQYLVLFAAIFFIIMYTLICCGAQKDFDDHRYESAMEDTYQNGYFDGYTEGYRDAKAGRTSQF